MKRHLKLLEFALSSLWRRKYKNLSVLVVYAFMVSVLASILLVTHSLKTEATLLLREAPDLVVQTIRAGRHELIPTSYTEAIEAFPGVGSVKARYWGYYYDALTRGNYTLLGVDGDLSDLPWLEGNLPAGVGECAIGEGVADTLKVDIGDSLFLIDSNNVGVAFDVVGIFGAESSLLTNDLVVLPKEDLRRFFGLPGDRATDIAVEVFNPNEVDTIATKIKRAFPDTRPITKSDLLKTYDAVFNWRSGMMLTMFSSAVFAFCILAWDKATGLNAEERREIGVLKALGWDTSDVLESKFWEGMAVSVTAFLLGVIAAFTHVFVLGGPVLSAVMKGWSVVFPEFRLTPYVNPYHVFVMAFLTVAPYVASTVIPSWKAATTDPESVIRT